MESENASKRSLGGTTEKKPSATDRYMIFSVLDSFFFMSSHVTCQFIFNVHSAFLLVMCIAVGLAKRRLAVCVRGESGLTILRSKASIASVCGFTVTGHCSLINVTGGPDSGDRTPFSKENQLTTETQCCEAIALMKHTTDEAIIKEKMKQTFIHRQEMVHDPVKSSLKYSPPFQDFLTSREWYVALRMPCIKIKLK